MAFHCFSLQVDIRAVPCNLTQTTNDSTLSPTKRLHLEEDNNGDNRPPVLDVPYDVTTKDRMCLHAITFLKVCVDKLSANPIRSLTLHKSYEIVLRSKVSLALFIATRN